MRVIASIILIVIVSTQSYANTHPKDSIYKNFNSVLKAVHNTKKKKGTYFLNIQNSDGKKVRVRIDLKKIHAELPIYKSAEFDIKKLNALTEEAIKEPNKKLVEFNKKVSEALTTGDEVKALRKRMIALQAVDSISRDSVAIANVQKDMIAKIKLEKEQTNQYEELFAQYEQLIIPLLGKLKTQYTKRLSGIIDEAYSKLKIKETTFKSLDDDAWFFDIRVNLIMVDTRRSMKVSYTLRGGEKKTEDLSPGGIYYLLHFVEFGMWGDEKAKVIKTIDEIKKREMKLTPYLTNEQFALVCNNQGRTERYLNRVVHYKDYENQKYADIEQLLIAENLSYKTIADARFLITQIEDSEAKKRYYLELQKKVPYFNQIDNISDKHRSCNITSLAMNLNFMGKGVDNMRLPNYLLFEAGGKEITFVDTWRELANKFCIVSDKKKDFVKLDKGNNKSESELKTYLTNLIRPILERGSSISLSLFPACKGHIVRIQGITQDGLVIDDPYGYCPLNCILMRESCKENSYTSKGERNNSPNYFGNDVTYTWEILTQTTLKYMVIFNE